MIYFLKGKIVFKEKTYLVMDVNNVGYQIFVSKIDTYEIDQDITLLIYEVLRENETLLVGFSNDKDKELFLDLISVQGLGPKGALNALNNATANEIIDAIYQQNYSFLMNYVGFNEQIAGKVILELRPRLRKKSYHNALYKDALSALVGMGFKKTKVDKTLKEVNTQSSTLEKVIKDALKLLKED